MTDCKSHRVQVFDRNGKFLRKFGEYGSLDRQLKSPEGLSIYDNGDIIVTDKGNKLMKIFSSSGEYLRSKSDLVDQVLNTCQSKKNQRIFFLALVKFKMAECLFEENPPSREINRFLRRNMGR